MCTERYRLPPLPGGVGHAAARVAADVAVGEGAHYGVSNEELAKRTLTNLYNERPTWLAQTHDVLDRAVLAAYGWPPDLPDDELLARLLELNLAREPA